MTLYASVTLFACLTLVTTWTLGSLEEKRHRLSDERFISTEWGVVHIWAKYEHMRARAGHLQRDHEHQWGRSGRQDQQDPGESTERVRSCYGLSCGMKPPLGHGHPSSHPFPPRPSLLSPS